MAVKILGRTFGSPPPKEDRALEYGSYPFLVDTQGNGSKFVQLNGQNLFSQVPVVFGCVKMIIDRLISLPRVVKMANGEPITSPRWLEQPNQWVDGDMMFSSAISSMLLNGNFYTIIRRTSYAGSIYMIEIPDPWEVECEWTGSDIIWHYRGYSYSSDIQDVMSIAHVPYITRSNHILGIGPGQATGLTSDVLYQAYQFLIGEFINNITGNVVISSPAIIGPDQLKQMRGQIRAHLTGPKNARVPILLGGGADAKSLGTSARDAQLVETLNSFNAQVAGMVFGVDPPLLGINTAGVSLTYNNQQEREEKLWEDALRPVAYRYEKFITKLLPRPRTMKIDESTLTGVTRESTLKNAMIEVDINLKAGFEVIPWAKIAESLGYALTNSAIAQLNERNNRQSSDSEGANNEDEDTDT